MHASPALNSPQDRLPVPRWPRATLTLPVFVECWGRKLVAHIRNISAGGAMVATAAPLASGMKVVLSCGSIEAAGVIVWGEQGRYGIKFDAPISQALIDEQLSRSRAVAKRFKPE